ncbi:hypothetical protein GCM10027059_26080 [Myceligenerans halotolerans]
MTGARSPALVTAAEFRAQVARDMSEDTLLANVRKLARELRLLVYHTHDSRKSERGWPDVVLASADRGLLLVRELKDERRKVTDEQADWLHHLRDLGIDADVWRPRDWVSGRIEKEMTTINRKRPTHV